MEGAVCLTEPLLSAVDLIPTAYPWKELDQQRSTFKNLKNLTIPFFKLKSKKI